MEKVFFYKLSVNAIFKELASSSTGLTNAEAAKRLKENGSNILPREKALTGLKLFLGQFKNPLIFILIAAFAISLLAGHGSDSLIILIVVLVTNTVGFLQEWKANNALAKLSGAVSYKVRTWRDGELVIVDREDLVIGDVIQLAAGDVIPADARIFLAKNLKISEAPLTGESLPIEKGEQELKKNLPLAERTNMAYQGTVIVDGSGQAIVTAIGSDTEIGQVAKLIKETGDTLTPLQEQINKFGVKLGLFLIAANVVIFLIGVISGRDIFEMFMVSVVIVVSAVPEGLIPAMTIILAIGMQRLAKKKGLVRRAIAAETLGSVSVICADKTGTLTQGEMMIDKLISYGKNSKVTNQSLALKIGVICNNGLIENPGDKMDNLEVSGNPTDKALLLAGAALGMYRKELEVVEARLDEIAFSSDLKMMATLNKTATGGEIIYIKGAPEKILGLSIMVDVNGKTKKIQSKDREDFVKQINEFTGTGKRMIALAYKNRVNLEDKGLTVTELKDLTLVGFFSLRDQIRNDVKQAIQACREASIRVVVITGDHAQTAISIVRDLGLEINNHNVMDGETLDKISDKELKARIKDIRLYARVSPHHKLRIVTALQEMGRVVAMTGDGINDSPALKKADIGVAVGNGTDVAKESADLILLDNSFLTIVEAVKQGRITFNNIQKVILYLFTDCFQEMIIIGTTVILGWPLPILPVQVLWIKLIEDPLPAASLAFDLSDDDVMKDKPRHKNQPFLTAGLQKIIAFYAVIMDVMALSLFYYYFKVVGDIDLARTVMFATLGLSTMFYIYAVRSLKKSIFKSKPFANRFLMAATFLGALLIFVSVYSPMLNRLLKTVPLSIMDWVPAILYGVIGVVIFEIGKKIFCEKKNC